MRIHGCREFLPSAPNCSSLFHLCLVLTLPLLILFCFASNSNLPVCPPIYLYFLTPNASISTFSSLRFPANSFPTPTLILFYSTLLPKIYYNPFSTLHSCFPPPKPPSLHPVLAAILDCYSNLKFPPSQISLTTCIKYLNMHKNSSYSFREF